jgi:Tfp pilus assembly protein PilF
MRFSLNSFFKQIVKVTLLSGMMILTTTMPLSAEVVESRAQLEDKLYRQALYFYFIGNYGEALNQISLNRQRFNSQSSQSRLFEAGLQVTVGLHHEATQSLYQLQKTESGPEQAPSIVDNTQASKSNTSPAELTLIALLELAEQQIQQGDNKTARQTLSKITQVSNRYSDQYTILNQLAYWPELPAHLAAKSDVESEESNDEAASNRQSSSVAYIKLNQALLHLEQGEFELAKPLLTEIKNTLWQAPSKTFWQLLFTPFSTDNEGDFSDTVINEKNQQQAVNDYAQLLLAQLYIKQESYEAAYYELKDFPQDSPYSESALFIFAFSAQKIKQNTTSFKLFNLMKERFPYSNLGWQAALLLATQVVEQMSLEEGMTSYQNAERLYQQRLTELASFHDAFLASNNLLNFAPDKGSVAVSKANIETKIATESTMLFFANKSYSTQSVWLQKALLDNELQANYQALIELDLITVHLQKQQQKSQWLKDTLALNNKRKAKVFELQQQGDYRSLIKELNIHKQKIAKIIAVAETGQQGYVFADQAQEQWLERIKQSKQAIALLDGSKKVDKYQKRIKRVEGVLTWQLQQALPMRLWQHQKQLKEIDQLLAHAEQQSNRFIALADSPSLLSGVGNRITTNAEDLQILVSNVAKLRVMTSTKIQNNVQQFVINQRGILEQHLLTSRHEMAAVLESMAKYDKRVERQLAQPKKKIQSRNINIKDIDYTKPNSSPYPNQKEEF